MEFHQVVNILTSASLASATATITGTATLPEPIPSPTPSPHLPPQAVTFLTVGTFGRVVSWIAVALYTLALLCFLYSTLHRPTHKRLLPILLTLISIVSLAAYYSYATNLGFAFQFLGTPDKLIARQVFYGRFVQYAATTPLILVTLGSFAGLQAYRIVLLAITGFALEVFGGIGTAVIHSGFHRGHLHTHHAAWGWLLLSLLSFLYPLLTLFIPARTSVAQRSPALLRPYTILLSLELLFFVPYPLFMLLGSWFNLLGPKAEFLANTLLDILTKPVFGWALLFVLYRHPEGEVLMTPTWAGEAGYEPVPQAVEGEEVQVAVAPAAAVEAAA
ncbi:family A G protein-coupled receptor-like protein [Dacryopinax primogenitus]|uniref:Family A G protein-coupled receptor-like protein n=1 Tax=Dacryopinax primogenitus (strain DJM 731) TaxID=1858805 RepID=M5G4F1_DACPD|nr:family A G protein-coupled receptor-like protein [Dacryopinax primogenitus]EJT98622.1 family A G protein-coupled receptor-like protein [Dacryopinax primogenitus]